MNEHSKSIGRVESGWDGVPLPVLLDHLVSDHADIGGTLLPAIEKAVSDLPSRETDPKRLEYLARAWPAFASDLTAHMQEEDTFLFPRLLRYQNFLRHDGPHPDFNGGSVKVFVAIRMLGNEREQMQALQHFLGEWEPGSASGPVGSDEEKRLHGLMLELQERLENHSRIEEKVVFPIASSLEKALYDMAISGSAP